MARLSILEYPDPRLRIRAEPVLAFDAALACLIEDLVETLQASGGIGLAATQVGVPRRIVAIDVSEKRDAPEVFINPEILSSSHPGRVEESCLSLPGIVGTVKRATRLRVRALDRGGAPFERSADGLLAVCLQHEIDHLGGRLFVDRLPLLRRLSASRRLAAGRQHPTLESSTGAFVSPMGIPSKTSKPAEVTR
jgi:peptide deformylase